MDIEIRRAKAGDLPEMVELWNLLMGFHQELDPTYELLPDAAERWVKYIETKFEDDEWRVLVAERNGRVVGYAVAAVQEYPPVFENPQHGFLQEIAVLREFRRQGIGRGLVEAAVEWLAGRDVAETTVRIDERNPASLALFASAGFDRFVAVKRKIMKK